ncbi:hypothetical protein MPSEU_000452100 [Mayamaea pseudoterrestris]|nr:hypothetical protein MPSEU_000452100 [Mayamaea pseudoterrestris]
MSSFRHVMLLGLLCSAAESLISVQTERLHQRLRSSHHSVQMAQHETATASSPFEMYGVDWIIVCPQESGSEKSYFGDRRNLKGSKKGIKGSKGFSKGLPPPPPYGKAYPGPYPLPTSHGSKAYKNHYIIHPHPCVKVPIGQSPTAAEAPVAAPTTAPELNTLFPRPTPTPKGTSVVPTQIPSVPATTSVPSMVPVSTSTPTPAAATTTSPTLAPAATTTLLPAATSAPTVMPATSIPTFGGNTGAPTPTSAAEATVAPSPSATQPSTPSTIVPTGISTTSRPTTVEAPSTATVTPTFAAPVVELPTVSPSPTTIAFPTITSTPTSASVSLGPTPSAPAVVFPTVSLSPTAIAFPTIASLTPGPSTLTAGPSFSVDTTRPSTGAESAVPSSSSSVGSSPTAVPSAGGTGLPTVASTETTTAPSLSMISVGPALSRAPTSAGSVSGTPFAIEFTTSSSATPSEDDVAAASTILNSYLESYFNDTFALSPLVSLTDFVATPTGSSPGAGTTDVGYDPSASFTGAEEVMPTQVDVDTLIQTALSPPQVSELLTQLASLPSDNPLSTTTDIVYSTDNVPSGAPTIVSSSKESVQTIPVAFIAASAAASVFLLGTAIALTRWNQRMTVEEKKLRKRHQRKVPTSDSSTQPSESVYEDEIEFCIATADDSSSLFDSPFALAPEEENVDDDNAEDDMHSWVPHSDDDPWLLRDY